MQNFLTSGNCKPGKIITASQTINYYMGFITLHQFLLYQYHCLQPVNFNYIVKPTFSFHHEEMWLPKWYQDNYEGKALADALSVGSSQLYYSLPDYLWSTSIAQEKPSPVIICWITVPPTGKLAEIPLTLFFGAKHYISNSKLNIFTSVMPSDCAV